MQNKIVIIHISQINGTSNDEVSSVKVFEYEIQCVKNVHFTFILF
jgi:hypothetical protein